jgi:hypothetical protein
MVKKGFGTDCERRFGTDGEEGILVLTMGIRRDFGTDNGDSEETGWELVPSQQGARFRQHFVCMPRLADCCHRPEPGEIGRGGVEGGENSVDAGVERERKQGG